MLGRREGVTSPGGCDFGRSVFPGRGQVGERSRGALSDPAPALCGAVSIAWVETRLLVNLEFVGSPFHLLSQVAGNVDVFQG